MKKIFLLVNAAVILLSLLTVSVFAGGLELKAEFEDGFSDDSGKLAVSVTNSSENEGMSGVTVSVTLPNGVSTASPSALLSDIAPGESVSKDFILTFEKLSVFAQYKWLIISGAAAFVMLFAVGFALLRKSKRAASLVLAIALLPALSFVSQAEGALQESQQIKLSHGGVEYEIDVQVTAVSAELAPAAPSRPLMGSRKPRPNEDYSTPQLSVKRIKEGAGPLGDHKIYVGKNDFMFLGEEIDYITGGDILADSAVKRIADNLTKIDAWANDNGIRFYLLICPSKVTAYSDYLPENKVSIAEQTSRQKLVQYLAENTDVSVTDATDAVIAARQEYGDELFYNYDTHWTQHAGYIAYSELMKAICADNDKAVFKKKEQYNVTEYETYMKDNAYYLGLYSEFTDVGPVYSLKYGPEAILTGKRSDSSQGQFRFCYEWEDGFRDDLKHVEFESASKDAPAAYMLRDSFSIAMFPFMKESFSKSTYEWAYSARASEVLESGADILILEVVERSLYELTTARINGK